MFQLLDTYHWPVTVYTQDAGEWTRGEFEAEFKYLSLANIEGIEAAEDADLATKVVALLSEVLVGVHQVAGPDGEPLPSSDALVAQALDSANLRAGLIDALIESLHQGERPDHIKNSLAPPSTGLVAPAPTAEPT